MSPLLKIQPLPFRLLLITEWVMLASCGSLAVVEAIEKQSVPVQHILILALIGMMGLILPSGKPRVRVFYTALEIGLIFYGTLLGYLHILPTLYLIVVIRSCFMFELPGRLIVTLLSFVLFLVHQVDYLQSMTQLVPPTQLQRFWMHQLAEILMFALGLFLVLQLANALLAERRAQVQLTAAHEQLRQYALQVEELAAVQERNRIARDIHDSLGHALTAMNVQMQTTAKLWPVDPIQAQSFFKQAQRLGEIAMKEVRQSVSTLRADKRQKPSLSEALDSLIEDFRQATGVTPSTNISLGTVPLQVASQVANVVYRTMQEALTNICKYAQATEVQVQVSTTPDQIHLAIADNGKGFSLDNKPKGFGLQGMQERVAALKGCLQIETEPGRGCRITVEIPLQQSPAPTASTALR